MDTSLLLARLLSPLFLAAGAGMLLNRDHYGEMLRSFLTDAALYYFSGALALVSGVAILLFHNLWVADWRVAITVIGWLAVVKGAVRLVFPRAGQHLAARLLGPGLLVSLGLVSLLLGAWLAVMGYLA